MQEGGKPRVQSIAMLRPLFSWGGRRLSIVSPGCAYVLFSTMAIAQVVANIPGRRIVIEFDSRASCCEHGWPFVYLRRDEVNIRGAEADEISVWALNDGVVNFRPAPLIGDCAIALTLFLVGRYFRSRCRGIWKAPRIIPSYSLRGLLAIVLICALCCAWWRDVAAAAKDREDAVAIVEGANGYTATESTLPDWITDLLPDWARSRFRRIVSVVIARGAIYRADLEMLVASPALRNVRVLSLGHRPLSGPCLEALEKLRDVEILMLDGTTIDDNALLRLQGMRRLRVICLSGTDVGNAACAMLGALPLLEEADLSRTAVTDAGLEAFSRSATLQCLSLSGTNVTDHGIRCLHEHAGLESLFLGGTSITDAAIPVICSFPRLSYLYIERSKITSEGARVLKTRLGDANVHHSNVVEDAESESIVPAAGIPPSN